VESTTTNKGQSYANAGLGSGHFQDI
jgi:hypothetical protein